MLRAAADIADYARSVIAAVDALGLTEIDLLGIHAGTALATELAVQRPELVKHLVLAETPPMDAATQADLRANYAHTNEPDAFGGHLLKAWFTARDHGQFWPWYDRRRAAAIRRQPHSAGEVHQYMVSILKAGPMFRRYAQAAFAPDAMTALSSVQVPMAFAAAPGSRLATAAQAAGRMVRSAQLIELPADMPGWASALLPFLDS